MKKYRAIWTYNRLVLENTTISTDYARKSSRTLFQVEGLPHPEKQVPPKRVRVRSSPARP